MCERLGDRAAAHREFRRFLEADRESPLAKDILRRLVEGELPDDPAREA